MLAANIIAVGKLKEKFLTDASAEYKKRLLKFCKLNIIEIKEEIRSLTASSAAINQALDKEGTAILNKIHDNSYVFALCVEGAACTSEQFAEYLEKVPIAGNSHITFIIGGSDGLSNAVKQRADICLSFSKMTFPHQLMRVILLEQIYRAFKIINNETYHK